MQHLNVCTRPGPWWHHHSGIYMRYLQWNIRTVIHRGSDCKASTSRKWAGSGLTSDRMSKGKRVRMVRIVSHDNHPTNNRHHLCWVHLELMKTEKNSHLQWPELILCWIQCTWAVPISKRVNNTFWCQNHNVQRQFPLRLPSVVVAQFEI